MNEITILEKSMIVGGCKCYCRRIGTSFDSSFAKHFIGDANDLTDCVKACSQLRGEFLQCTILDAELTQFLRPLPRGGEWCVLL